VPVYESRSRCERHFLRASRHKSRAKFITQF
jgi:hypothetical protein